MLSRRTFVSWLSGLGAAFGVIGRSRPGLAVEASATGPIQSNSLDAVLVARLGEVVLPTELGDAGVSRVAREFTQWIGGYRPGVEVVHPYGSSELRNTGESPAGRWRAQLATLEQESRQKHQRGFAALSIAQRRELVTAAISSERANRMPQPLDANHVALALVAWYFGSPDAIDRCYQAQIGRNQCRPLVNAPRQPLPLANRRPGP